MTQYSGVFTLQQQGQALTSGQWCTDPYFKNTTLLLHADGVANGAQNNTFLDSSTNAFAITRNGNTTQGSFTPYGPTWSNYFGSANFFYSGSNAAFALGTGDFCVEAWVFPTAAYTTYNYILGVAATGGLVFYVTGGNLVVRGYNDVDILSSSTIPALNTWTHIAATRSGTTLRIFVNGVQTASTTSAYNFAQGAIYAGNDSTNAAPWYGYISNLRLVKGSPVYTSAFAPSTTPLTAITNTSWLVCQSNRFIDAGTANSGSPFTLTVSGTPSVQRFSPFAPQYQYTPDVIGGSGYFDGYSDYLTVPYNSTAFQFTGDFTIECWVNPTSRVSSYPALISNYNVYGANGLIGLFVGHALDSTKYSVSVNGSDGVLVSTSTIKYNSWTHLAIVRSGSSMKLYVNGVAEATATNSTTITGTANNWWFGTAGDSPSNNGYNGYVSNLRIIKGVAVYTGTFSPPALAPLGTTCANSTSAYSSTTNVDTSSTTGASLLLKFANANIYDNAMMNDLETVGNAQVSTNVVKYGSGSLAFDGSGDYLLVPMTSTIGIPASSPFTYECWIYLTAAQANYRMLASDAAASTTYIAINSTGLEAQFGGTSSTVASCTYSFSTSTWYHVALVRNSSNAVVFYVNGVAQTMTNSTQNNAFLYQGATLYIGRWNGATPYEFNGYIDDLRITKGVARYTANFQPPKVAFANQ